MKQPDHQPATAVNTSLGQKLRMLVAFGAIAVAGAGGYKCGQNSLMERIQKLESDSALKDDRLTEAEKNLKEARETIEGLSQGQRLTMTKLLEAEEKVSHPDERVCIDVIDKAVNEKVSQLASTLGITNQHDIEVLKSVLRKGYTQIEAIFDEGKVISLVDPQAEQGAPHSNTSITLEEPIKNVPEKFLSESDKVPKSEQELKLEKEIADGKAEEVLKGFDPESIRPSSEDPKSKENQTYQAFVDVQSDLLKTTDLKMRKDLLCRFIAQQYSQMLGERQAAQASPDSEEPGMPSTPDSIRRDRLEELYLKAMLNLIGFESYDECLDYVVQKQFVQKQ